MSQDNELRKISERLQKLEDREAIRDVIHRYCRAADRCDAELFKSCYHPDATDDHGFFGGNAWDFVDYVIPVLLDAESSVHAITNILIEFNEGSAKAFTECQWSVIHRVRTGEGFTDFWHNGRYLDVFEKRNGEWKILHRACVSDCDRWIHAIDLRKIVADAMGPAASDQQMLLGGRGKKDAVYSKFAINKLMKTRPPVADFWGRLKLLLGIKLPS